MSYSSENTEYYAPGIKMPRQDNYETAYNEAVAEFQQKDADKICSNAGIRKSGEDENKLVIPFLNRNLLVAYPEADIAFDDNDDVQLWLKILLLHYMNTADGAPASGRLITFKEITGGLSYYPTFQKRTIIPLIKAFSGNYDAFILSSQKLGGVLSEFGRYSVAFSVFPRIDLLFNIQEGDEEFPPGGNVIFDSSVMHYLSSEDIVVLCNMLSVMIIKSREK